MNCFTLLTSQFPCPRFLELTRNCKMPFTLFFISQRDYEFCVEFKSKRSNLHFITTDLVSLKGKKLSKNGTRCAVSQLFFCFACFWVIYSPSVPIPVILGRCCCKWRDFFFQTNVEARSSYMPDRVWCNLRLAALNYCSCYRYYLSTHMLSKC